MNVWKKIPIIVLIIGTILDILTTTTLYLQSTRNPLKPFTEINPLYHLLGNYWTFTAINIALISLLIWIYYKQNQKSHYIITKYILYTVLLLTGIVRIIASINNYTVIQQEPLETIQQVEQIETQIQQQHVTAYSKLATILIFTPLTLIILNFILFQKAYKLKIGDDKRA